MSTFTLEQLPGEPIIVLTLDRAYNFVTDFPKSYAQVYALLECAAEPVFYITDVTNASFDLDTIILAANKTSGEKSGTFRHPKIKGVILVTTDDALHLAAQGLTSEIYGNVPARAFDTLDEALAYARAH